MQEGHEQDDQLLGDQEEDADEIYNVTLYAVHSSWVGWKEDGKPDAW